MCPPPRKLTSLLSSASPRPVRVFGEGKHWVSWAGVLISGGHSLPSWWPCWHSLLRPAVGLIQWGVSEGRGSGLFSPQDTEPQCWHGSAWVAEAFQNSQRSVRIRDPSCPNKKYREGKVQTVAARHSHFLLSRSFPHSLGLKQVSLSFPGPDAPLISSKSYDSAVLGRSQSLYSAATPKRWSLVSGPFLTH